MAAPAPSPRHADGVLVVEGVDKAYGDLQVLSDLSLSVGPGRVLGLLGPNGAGKTTLVRMVLDLTRPDRGRISVLGAPPSVSLRARVGYLPEERGVYPKQRVLDVLAYLVSLAGVPDAEARRRAAGWLHRVGLTDFEHKKVRALSKGMQQKVQIGAAVLHQPDLVILDEPFTGLDPVNRRLVADVVREAAARGAGVIVSTHLLDQAQRLCDEVVLLRRGRVLVRGSMDEARRRFSEGRIELAAPAGWAGHEAIRPLVRAVHPRPEGHDEVVLAGGTDGEALLRALLSHGLVPRHFSHALPSLEEVFVRAVEADRPAEVEAARAELGAGGATTGGVDGG